MRLMFYLTLLLYGPTASAQFSYDCGNYTTVGDTITDTPGNNCDGSMSGLVLTDSLPWTGAACNGTLVSTSNSGPVSCMTLIYTAINWNDFAAITTDTGGNLTISAINATVSDTVVGPYQCTSMPNDFGTVAVQVCSSIPFNSVTLVNIGCASGWVGNCGSASFSSIELSDLQRQIHVYPNPAVDNIRIVAGTSLIGSTITVYDLSGKFIMQEIATTAEPHLNIGSLTRGYYLIKVQTDWGTEINKIVVE